MSDLPATHAPPATAPESIAPDVPDLPAATPEAAAPAAEPADASPAAGPAPADAAHTGLSPAECGAKLAELFPALFAPPAPGTPVKPIKLRVHADIMARAPGLFSKRSLGVFFSRYTTGNAYLKALAADGAQRYDLDGQPAGEIAVEHRAAAVEELARRQAIAAERRAALRRSTPRPAPGPSGDAAVTAGDAPAGAPKGHTPRRDGGRRDGPREERRPAPGQPRRDGGRPAGHPRPDGPRRDDWRPDRPRHDGPRSPRHDRPPHPGARAPAAQEPAAATALPTDPAARERLLLLRAYESSPLSKANFCALKRISEAELDALIAQAAGDRPRR